MSDYLMRVATSGRRTMAAGNPPVAGPQRMPPTPRLAAATHQETECVSPLGAVADEAFHADIRPAEIAAPPVAPVALSAPPVELASKPTGLIDNVARPTTPHLTRTPAQGTGHDTPTVRISRPLSAEVPTMAAASVRETTTRVRLPKGMRPNPLANPDQVSLVPHQPAQPSARRTDSDHVNQQTSERSPPNVHRLDNTDELTQHQATASAQGQRAAIHVAPNTGNAGLPVKRETLEFAPLRDHQSRSTVALPTEVIVAPKNGSEIETPVRREPALFKAVASSWSEAEPGQRRPDRAEMNSFQDATIREQLNLPRSPSPTERRSSRLSIGRIDLNIQVQSASPMAMPALPTTKSDSVQSLEQHFWDRFELRS